MPNDRNRNSVLRQLTALQGMNENELREKWRDLFGNNPPRYRKPFLVKRLSYRVQELFYGGLSKNVKGKLSEIASNDPMVNCLDSNYNSGDTLGKTHRKTKSDRQMAPGTRFIREWNGAHYEVTVREDGFEFGGKIYRSLSAVSTEITGTKWNGLVFWGLKKR